MRGKVYWGALEHLLGKSIEQQEAEGQREMVESVLLPVSGDWDVLEAWGVRRVEGSDDPFFRSG